MTTRTVARRVLDAPIWRSRRALAWIVFGVSLAVFLVQSRAITRPGYVTLRDRSFLLGGDEPWYLLTTRSIALDGDYNLINDRVEQEFWDRDISGYDSERLRLMGHGATKTAAYWEHRVYPIGQIGLGIVLAPAFRLGLLWDGQARLGCVWFLCVVGAIVVQQIFWLGCELGARPAVAALGALAGALSMPLIAYVTQIFTELVAALLIMVAVRMVFTSRWSPLVRAAIAGVCLAYLPWLHEKYYPLVLVGVAMYLVASRPWRVGRVAAFAAPLVVSAGLLMAYYHAVYGVVYPVYHHEKAIALSAGLGGGMTGTLFDRTDGLVPFWPMAAFGLVGLVWLVLDRQRSGPWLAALVVVQWLLIGMFEGWTGARCPPLRHWVPVIPLLVVGTIVALGRLRRRWLVVLAGVMIVYGIVVGERNMSHPRALMRDSVPMAPGPGTFASARIERAYHVFPDMKTSAGERVPSASDHARGAAWLVALAGFVVVVTRLERGPRVEAVASRREEDDGAAESES